MGQANRFVLAAPLLSLFTVGAGAAEPPPELGAHESPRRPTPAWVKMTDLGAQDPALKGYRAPAGVKLEVVAREPDVINPVGMRFLEDGRLALIEWMPAKSSARVDTTFTRKDGSKQAINEWRKDGPDRLRVLLPDGAGRFGRAEVLFDDLQLPSSVLAHDGWYYFTTRGAVVRRRQSRPGGPFDVQERVVQGFSAFDQHQLSGLSVTADGWLMVTSGDDDSHPEGSDGSRQVLLRNGAVWRLRPDGSQVSMVARGFRNPYGNVAQDELGNVFHTDNDQEDGSKFQGCRIMHVLDEADYGWRLKPGVRCCWADRLRGAIFGELPGRVPPLLKTGRGAPTGLAVYQGAAFPAFFRGLLILPDVFQRNVRAYKVERTGTTFAVTEQFDLITTDDPMFRPSQVAVGPDGAIYLADWRVNSAGPGAAWGNGTTGRIWRLSWAGAPHLPDAPAIARGPMDAWVTARQGTVATLAAALDTGDFQRRLRVVDELVRRGTEARSALLEVAGSTGRPVAARAAAFMGATRVWQADVQETALRLLGDSEADLRRIAAEAFGRNAPTAPFVARALTALQTAGGDAHPAVRRESALALARVAAPLPKSDPRRGRISASLLTALVADDRGDVHLHDALLRALERLGRPALAPLARLAVGADPRQRALALGELEALRIREGAALLDEVLLAQRKLPPGRRLDEPQLTRLLVSYRYIQSEPAVDVDALVSWLRGSDRAPPALQTTALESLAAVGETDMGRVLPLMLRLLTHPSAPLRLTAIRTLGDARLFAATPRLMDRLADRRAPLDERRTALTALSKLRGKKFFSEIQFQPGVERHVDRLLQVFDDPSAAPLHADILTLVAQIDFGRARPLALARLENARPDQMPVMIALLAADARAAIELAERFVAGRLPVEALPQVASALQRHASGKEAETVAQLRPQVMKRGLSVTADPASVKRLEALVREKGDPLRGRAVFLDRGKAACVTCHRVAGAGGQLGPDLTGLHQNSSVAKLLESILEPSKEIKEGFEIYNVVTKRGQTYEGFKVLADSARTVLRDVAGNDVTILPGEVAKMTVSRQSLMPEGLAAALNVDELVDLVAFLLDAPAQKTLGGLLTEAMLTHAPDDAATRATDPLTVPGLEWATAHCRPDGSFDLKTAGAETRGEAMLVAHVRSARAQSAVLRVRGPKGTMVWLGGRKLTEVAGPGGDALTAEAQLTAGESRLLVKVPRSAAPVSVSVEAAEEVRLSASGK